MSVKGQKLPRRAQVAMYALRPKAAAAVTRRRVALGQKRTLAPQQGNVVIRSSRSREQHWPSSG
jgi:hypothetical protein